MKNIPNRKGFTIIELLAVIVIIGILIGISIPAISGLFHKQELKQYEYHQKIVEEAVKAYVEKYSTDLDENANCFNISYQSLIDEKLLQEEKVTCSSKVDSTLGGVIQITKLPSGNNNYSYKYHYKCKTTNNNRIVYDGGKAPSGCTDIK